MALESSTNRCSRMQRQYDLEAGVHKSSEAGPSGMSMWVDKYRPKQFSDLLGDDVSVEYHILAIYTVSNCLS